MLGDFTRLERIANYPDYNGEIACPLNCDASLRMRYANSNWRAHSISQFSLTADRLASCCVDVSIVDSKTEERANALSTACVVRTSAKNDSRRKARQPSVNRTTRDSRHKHWHPACAIQSRAGYASTPTAAGLLEHGLRWWLTSPPPTHFPQCKTPPHHHHSVSDAPSNPLFVIPRSEF